MPSGALSLGFQRRLRNTPGEPTADTRCSIHVLDNSLNSQIEFGQHHGPRNARELTLRKNKQNNSKRGPEGEGEPCRMGCIRARKAHED